MKAVVINDGGKISVEEVPNPKITSPDEVLVKVAYSGLCGSDIPRVFEQGAHFYPIILGHEFSGIVEEIGSDVEDIKPGDKVCCVPLHPCMECEECKRGYYSLCKQYNFIGSRRQGGNAEYISMPTRNVYKLPEYVDLKQGAFFEPVTVGLHAILLTGGCKDKNVVVIGVGTIGLLAVQCAKALGASSVVAVDINQERLELAKELGADQILNPTINTIDEMKQVLHESRFEQLILETAGSPTTVKMSLSLAGPRAQIALVGTLHKPLSLEADEFGMILRKELQVIGCWMNYSGMFPGEEWSLTARLFGDGALNIDKLIQSCDGLDGFSKKVTSLNGKPMSGKILLDLMKE